MQNRVWLITGCSSGFGRELALAAAAAGDRVMATARRPETLTPLTRHDGIRATTLDVTDPDSIRTAVTETLDAYGRIDVLVNNAGSLVLGAVEEFTMAELRQQLEVVFFGAAEVTKAVVPLMRAQGSGTIVQMSSLGGRKTYPAFGAYHAAKWALEGFSETLAAEVAPHGVHVLIVEPGAFRTAFNDNKHVTRELAAYRDTAGATRQLTVDLTDAEPNDPVKGAAAILTAVDSPHPPLRLLLGGDAVDGLRAHHEALLAEVTAWEQLSRSTAVA
ncbi:SDR family NAD(P)-dependent oxidoreductase [Asanoa siamensis]|uniref:Short-chain dehydrogenase/reductase n=1 Tax=Asanoa siamensis TaxID=926357 RepID=A0ABQ4D4A7_9ACTN|nr:SDR family NAD(P)-dependent oxidoreductase [Asanoa siamensis]GIF78374.1 short-chain dehydrogenase/reductase [Asanoa siamensis]